MESLCRDKRSGQGELRCPVMVAGKGLVKCQPKAAGVESSRDKKRRSHEGGGGAGQQHCHTEGEPATQKRPLRV